ncbi:MAG: hypothetical protein BM485_11650 [Desulfobulbaceae bacterium DB1]|nr:MAG: hypothetical protein BM485_11650 [Desulfobulbaceae bacterium DB1]
MEYHFSGTRRNQIKEAVRRRKSPSRRTTDKRIGKFAYFSADCQVFYPAGRQALAKRVVGW